MGIEDDRGTARGAVLDNTLVELSFGDMLEELVDGQLERRPRRRRLLDPAENLVLCVSVNDHLTVFSADRLVECELDAAQAVIVDTNPAQQMRGELLVRIVTQAFFAEP